MVKIDVNNPINKGSILYKPEKVLYNRLPNEAKLLYNPEDLIRVCPNNLCNKPVYYLSDNKKYPELTKRWHCNFCGLWFENPAFRKRDKRYWGSRELITKKITLQDKNLIDGKELIKQIKNIGKLKNKNGQPLVSYTRVLKIQAFIAFLYLTASRVEEIVGLRNQITREILYQPILRKQLCFEESEGKDCLVVKSMPVFKRKLVSGAVPLRNCPIVIEHEPELIDIIRTYIRVEVKYDDMALFPSNYKGYSSEKHPSITYQTARNWCKLITFPLNNLESDSPKRPAFNHYFRHLRLSHLAQIYGMNDTALRNYIGWADSKMAAKYVHLGISDMVRMMIHNKRGKND